MLFSARNLKNNIPVFLCAAGLSLTACNRASKPAHDGQGQAPSHEISAKRKDFVSLARELQSCQSMEQALACLDKEYEIVLRHQGQAFTEEETESLSSVLKTFVGKYLRNLGHVRCPDFSADTPFPVINAEINKRFEREDRFVFAVVRKRFADQTTFPRVLLARIVRQGSFPFSDLPEKPGVSVSGDWEYFSFSKIHIDGLGYRDNFLATTLAPDMVGHSGLILVNENLQNEELARINYARELKNQKPLDYDIYLRFSLLNELGHLLSFGDDLEAAIISVPPDSIIQRGSQRENRTILINSPTQLFELYSDIISLWGTAQYPMDEYLNNFNGPSTLEYALTNRVIHTCLFELHKESPELKLPSPNIDEVILAVQAGKLDSEQLRIALSRKMFGLFWGMVGAR